MFTVDHINELRAELKGCVFTKRERSRVEAELAALIAERDAAECVSAWKSDPVFGVIGVQN